VSVVVSAEHGDTMSERRGYTYYDKTEKCWYARTTITAENGARRNIKKRAKSKSEAREVLKALLRKLDDEGSRVVVYERLTFNDLADFYERHYCKPAEYADGKKVAGLRDVYRAQYCLRRFRRYFGARRLREIMYRDVRAYYLMRLKEPTHYASQPSIATMNRELGVLRRILGIGVREGWITRNPFSMGEPLISPASERRREQILTLEEERHLLDACENPQRRFLCPLIICLLDTGARLSEFHKHLRWNAVNFATRTVILEAMTTKTLKGRQVSMTERMYRELLTLWESSDGIGDSLVFNSTVRQVRFAFRAACKEAGISYGSPDGITLHSLRHTAATRLVKGHMPLQLVGRILGHSQPQTTYRYLTADADATAQAAAIMDALQAQTAETQATAAPELVN
jgi:integrase